MKKQANKNPDDVYDFHEPKEERITMRCYTCNGIKWSKIKDYDGPWVCAVCHPPVYDDKYLEWAVDEITPEPPMKRRPRLSSMTLAEQIKDSRNLQLEYMIDELDE